MVAYSQEYFRQFLSLVSTLHWNILSFILSSLNTHLIQVTCNQVKCVNYGNISTVNICISTSGMETHYCLSDPRQLSWRYSAAVKETSWFWGRVARGKGMWCIRLPTIPPRTYSITILLWWNIQAFIHSICYVKAKKQYKSCMNWTSFQQNILMIRPLLVEN